MKTIGKAFDTILEISAFSGAGFFSAIGVNYVLKKESSSFFFKKIPHIDLKAAVICAASFAVIDRLAYAIFSSLLGKGLTNRPLYSALRVGASAWAASALFNQVPPFLKFGIVDKNLAMAVVLTAVFIYNFILSQAALFTLRYHSIEKKVDPSLDGGEGIDYF